MAVRKETAPPPGVRGLRALLQELKQAGPAPAYLLTGSDRRDLDRAIDALQAACVPPELEGFNVTRLRGLEDTHEDVVGACEILPMLGDRRFVLVREPEKLSGDGARLAAYCARPCPSTTLVLAPITLDRRFGWVKAIEATARVVEFTPPQGAQLGAWIREELAARGASIRPDALALMVDLVAAETVMLSNEIEKLSLACAGGTVTVEDVDALLGRTRGADIWALTNAVEDGDVAAAHAALRRLFDEGTAAPLLVGTLDWCLGRLFATEAPRAFMGRQQALDRRREELRGHGERLFGLLREADRLVRTTGGRPEAVLERLVLEMPPGRGR